MALKRTFFIALTVVATLFVALLILNLSLGDKQIDTRLARLYPVDDPQFTRAMSHVLTPGLVPGNRVEALINGDEIFPAMLSAIGSAQQTITFETYIYWSGSIGREFAAALRERAQAGVKVHILLDWSAASSTMRPSMRCERPVSKSAATTRRTGTTSTSSTIARTASCSLSMARSVSPEAWESPMCGVETHKIRSTGASDKTLDYLASLFSSQP